MSTTEITSKVENIKTLQAMIDELTAEMEAAKDEIKAHMTAQGVEEMTVSCFKVRYKDVTSSRFDSTAFKKTHADLYEQYSKQTTSKRFSIA
ncbi:MAG: hypothetical protein IJ368_03650 [Oscillospiraceae bacterium]|nr:hypothetical protein [Oscillospiraceae bacterium]